MEYHEKINIVKNKCKNYHFQLTISGQELFIVTPASHWHFNLLSEKIKLYHLSQHAHSRSFSQEYHQQPVDFKTDEVKNLMKYIYKHDKKAIKGCKSHMEKLYESIEYKRIE